MRKIEEEKQGELALRLDQSKIIDEEDSGNEKG